MKPAVVRLKPRKALPFFCRHPWVFQGAIARLEGAAEAGSEVRVESAEGQFVARGLYNPHSKIQVRLYSWVDAPLDAEFWRGLVSRAIELRHRLFAGTDTARACRLIFSEGDGLSGLTVDRYGDWLLTQWTSAALWTQREAILTALRGLLQPTGIWVRTEKGMSELEQLEAVDGLAWGTAPPNPLEIKEHGLRYAVDVVTGQKTGFYFDQRENRLAVARYAQNAEVLDVCCYSGGFGLTALKCGGARSATFVDSSRPALELAQSNAVQNGYEDQCTFRQGDASQQLEQLASEGRQFDVVVLDPPKLARSQGGLQRALKGYSRLIALGLRVTRPGGIFVTCSCSGLVSLPDFQQAVVQAALTTGCEIQWLEQRWQGVDHPVSAHCLESQYLKCLIGRVQT